MRRNRPRRGSGHHRPAGSGRTELAAAAAREATRRGFAARAAASATAVVVVSVLPPGLGTELRLGGLSEGELAAVAPGVPPWARHAVWLASRGLPGIARSMAAELAAAEDNLDPLV